ncbi:MAG: PAS domain S-box protein [Syntrophales bacterium]
MTQTKSNYKVGRLIIVDDETELMTALCELLTRHGYETVGCTSGAEALAKLKEQDFDLLLTDLMMPEMNGIELLQAALKIDPDIVGIVMTGQGTVQTAVEAMKVGALDYIMKPFKLNGLLPVLSRAMEVRYLRTENIQLRNTVAMHELGQALAFSSDLNQILNKVADAVMQQCDADEASIMLPTSDGKELIIAVARGGHAEHIGKRIAMGQGIAGWVAQNREPVTLNGEVHDERFASINPRADIRAAVSIPLLVGSNLVGVLNINITHSHRPFTLGQIKTLKMLVTVVSPILENVRLNLQTREAQERYRSIFDNAQDGIALADARTGALVNCNQALCSMVEREETELVGQMQTILHSPQSCIDGQSPTFKSHLEEGAALALEETLLSKSGALIPVEIRAARIALNGRDYLLGIFRDITKRKQAEVALRESEDKYRTIIENMEEGYYEVDIKGNFTFFNESMRKFLGYEREELSGMNNRQYLDEENARKVYQVYNRAYRTGEPVKNLEWQILRKDGDLRDIEVSISLIRNGDGQPTGFRGIARDNTDRKQAEEALRESEKRYRELNDFLPISIFEIDAAGSFISFNRTALEVFRYNQEDYKEGMNALQFFAPEEWQRVGENMGRVIQGTSIPGQEFTFLRKDGSTFIGLIYASPKIHENKTAGIRGAIIDITERKLAEESLRNAEERYRSIFENAQEGIFQTTYEGQYLAANRALATILGYDSPEDLMTTIIDISTQLYVNPEVRKALLKMIEEQGPAKGVETQFYRKDGSIIWVSVNQQAVRDAEGRVLYYEGFNEDITTKKESIERIKKALGATVQAIAVTVETRDPYTAGHQRRVADLARAIATEMNLPTDQIDAIQMAAGIHDLGKISVPAEILSKPSKLTDLEFGIIKTHAQSGYDILKDIEFPWPIARMVLEHHERMDGSGYPRNLKRDDILMEARILAVSDVVEAIGSHRPYRPSLGIDAALEEIENNRGTHYDTSTVDACLRIFRENGYQLKQT